LGRGFEGEIVGDGGGAAVGGVELAMNAMLWGKGFAPAEFETGDGERGGGIVATIRKSRVRVGSDEAGGGEAAGASVFAGESAGLFDICKDDIEARRAIDGDGSAADDKEGLIAGDTKGPVAMEFGDNDGIGVGGFDDGRGFFLPELIGTVEEAGASAGLGDLGDKVAEHFANDVVRAGGGEDVDGFAAEDGPALCVVSHGFNGVGDVGAHARPGNEKAFADEALGGAQEIGFATIEPPGEFPHGRQTVAGGTLGHQVGAKEGHGAFEGARGRTAAGWSRAGGHVDSVTS